MGKGGKSSKGRDVRRLCSGGEHAQNQGPKE